jgi:Zn-dependent metalloprotease
MLASAAILAALLSPAPPAGPIDRFVAAHPASLRAAAPGGRQLLHASGFAAQQEGGAQAPEASARAFLSRHGEAFGLFAGQRLLLVQQPAPGEAGLVRFAREVDGLPVFGGELAVGVDGQGRVTSVDGAEAGLSISGGHVLREEVAAAFALRSLGPSARLRSEVAVALGLRARGGLLRAVYRVDFASEEPAAELRTWIDGETGAVLLREDLRLRAAPQGTVYDFSPVETASGPCAPGSGGGRTFCASTSQRPIANLLSSDSLLGTQIMVYNCKGLDAPPSKNQVPGSCQLVSAQGGAFAFAPDTTWTSKTDDFAAVMAYYHLDKHVTFIKGLDPSTPTGSGRAIGGTMPALVNVMQGGQPFENAYYSSLLDGMVFGQGAAADYAYDASVMYHEFTHGVVQAWGGFNIDLDAKGGLDEPAAVNEGTADSMAAGDLGRSQIGAFISATEAPASPFLRDLADPAAARSCRGSGALSGKLGISSIDGLDGEVHDDGEIWNGFFWEVHTGLEGAGIRGCGGACPAAAAILYRTLQTAAAAGGKPTLGSYWQTFEAAAAAVFPANTAVTRYIDCVAKRRGFDKCDRTLPLYSGETHAQFMRLGISALQLFVTTTQASSLSVCGVLAGDATAYLRASVPVALTFSGSSANVIADASAPFNKACSSGKATIPIPGAGTWYLLLSSSAALVPGFNVFVVTASGPGVSARPASSAPGTCTVPGGPLALSPGSASAAPGATVQFSASGGSNSGYVFSLATNGSGGKIGQTGAYTAGAKGPATDVVQVTDSKGTAVTASVAVGPAITVIPGEVLLPKGGTQVFSASGGSGSGYTWSILENQTGGNVSAAAGLYTAGGQPGTDQLQVVDSLGNLATAHVTVPGDGGCSAIGPAGGLWLLGVAVLLGRRRRAQGKA